MNREALIRFCCATDKQQDPEQLAFPYLEALEGAGLGVRVMPLGATHFTVPPWDALGHLFLTALRTRFINVVCVPPGLPLLHGGTALAGLFTLGIPNVAITAGDGAYTAKEIQMLQLYNRVIVPDGSAAVALATAGISFEEVPPEPGSLSLLFSGITLV